MTNPILLLFPLCFFSYNKITTYPIQKLGFLQNKSSNNQIEYRIITSVNNTYGYEILFDNKVVIRQTSIPGIPGLKGFYYKIDAENVAYLMINKMNKGIMPPTINKSELDSLNIKY